jgi:hypothetical protein
MGNKGNKGSALNGGPDSSRTGLLKVLGSTYTDAKAVSTTCWDVGA